MPLERDLLRAFEVHSPEAIRSALNAGISPAKRIGSTRPIDCLIEMYLRSPRFAECLRVMLDAGATIDDPLLQAVLLDDADALRPIVNASREAARRKLSLVCAYTSCRGVTPLHICAEFNSVQCARLLLDVGADANARADFDRSGFGGQTPIFHAVNSNGNHCRPVMEVLAEAGADLEVKLKGLLWGEGFEWETLLLDITPSSYAQCGLYRQFHRNESDIYSNLQFLYQRKYGSAVSFPNVPNNYVSKS